MCTLQALVPSAHVQFIVSEIAWGLTDSSDALIPGPRMLQHCEFCYRVEYTAQYKHFAHYLDIL